jgi:hypothetical protein
LGVFGTPVLDSPYPNLKATRPDCKRAPSNDLALELPALGQQHFWSMNVRPDPLSAQTSDFLSSVLAGQSPSACWAASVAAQAAQLHPDYPVWCTRTPPPLTAHPTPARPARGAPQRWRHWTPDSRRTDRDSPTPQKTLCAGGRCRPTALGFSGGR